MAKFVDITGEKFGRLTAIRGIGNGPNGKWVFRCDCGKEKAISKQNVCQGKVKSCGCLASETTSGRNTEFFVDLSGRRFGRLTAIKYSKVGCNYYYTCQCDCGKEIEVLSAYLKSGHTKSCGCLRVYRHPEKDVGLRKLYYRYTFRARHLCRKFDISLADFKEITQKDCFYCGRPPISISKSKSQHSEYVYNGLDRVDSSKGYTKDNVVACCVYCNRMKLHYSQQEFKDLISRIFSYYVCGNTINTYS